MKSFLRFAAAFFIALAVFVVYVWLLYVCITFLGYSVTDTGRTRGWAIFCAYLAGSLAFVPVFCAVHSLRHTRMQRFTLGFQATLISFLLCVAGLTGLTLSLLHSGIPILSITLLLMRGGTHIFAAATLCTMLITFLILQPARQTRPIPRSMIACTLIILCLTALFAVDYVGTRGFSLPPFYPWRGVPRFAAALCLAGAGTGILAARGSALCKPLLAALAVLALSNWCRDFLVMGYNSLPPLVVFKSILLLLALWLVNGSTARAWLKQ